jgi:glycosyltransferase involved in cell wall biosynthesis
MPAWPSISMCFPVYNEEGNIERAVTGASALLAELCDEPEIVAVDDASTDRTPEILQALAASHPELRTIRLRRNTRYAGALARALKEARGELLFYTDADCPVAFSAFRDALGLMGDADVVAGYRKGRHEGARRLVYSEGYNTLIRRMFGLPVRDINFAFKIFRREVIQGMEIRARGSFVDAEILIGAHRRGYTIREQGVRYQPRVAGVSTLADLGIARRCAREALQYRLGLPPWSNGHLGGPRIDPPGGP